MRCATAIAPRSTRTTSRCSTRRGSPSRASTSPSASRASATRSPTSGCTNVTEGYLEFLRRGGRLRLADLSAALVRGLLRFKLPIITGLSSTYLYRARREYGPNDTPDDVRGMPVGHFVVIAGHDAVRRRVLVVDPYQPNPYGQSLEYWISIDRVVAAILLGIVTHDANLLVVYPRRRPLRVVA